MKNELKFGNATTGKLISKEVEKYGVILHLYIEKEHPSKSPLNNRGVHEITVTLKSHNYHENPLQPKT